MNEQLLSDFAFVFVGENNACIPPTLEEWVYIVPTHGPLDGPLYTWAQYTPTATMAQFCLFLFIYFR